MKLKNTQTDTLSYSPTSTGKESRDSNTYHHTDNNEASHQNNNNSILKNVIEILVIVITVGVSPEKGTFGGPSKTCPLRIIGTLLAETLLTTFTIISTTISLMITIFSITMNIITSNYHYYYSYQHPAFCILSFSSFILSAGISLISCKAQKQLWHSRARCAPTCAGIP